LPKKNDEPKVMYEIKIEVFDNGVSRHSHPKDIPLEIIRDILFRHLSLFQEQITMIKMQNQMNKVKIINPNQLPPKLKLHS
jgi:hypothetical protein